MTRIEPAQLPEGRRLALEHGRRLLEGARALAFDHPVGAVPLFYHGVEEVGKAALIERAIKTGHGAEAADLRARHTAKWREATKIVPSQLLMLRSGYFDPAILDPAIFDVGELVDPVARERRLYVDWTSGAASIDGVMQLIDGWLAGEPLIRD